MLKASIALFRNHKKDEEMRLYFPTVDVDGRTLRDVTILPHRCDPSVCAYGDHVHVDVFEDDKFIRETGQSVTLSDQQAEVFMTFLRAQLAVDSLVNEFETHVGHVSKCG